MSHLVITDPRVMPKGVCLVYALNGFVTILDTGWLLPLCTVQTRLAYYLALIIHANPCGIGCDSDTGIGDHYSLITWQWHILLHVTKR